MDRNPIPYSMIVTLTIFVALAAIVYQGYLQSRNLSKVMVFAGELGALEHDPEANRRRLAKPRVAIGYGSCTDLYIPASGFLKNSVGPAVKTHWDERPEPTTITNEEELLLSFGQHFRMGAAAE